MWCSFSQQFLPLLVPPSTEESILAITQGFAQRRARSRRAHKALKLLLFRRKRPKHKPARRGREMIDLLAVEEPKPKPAKIRTVSCEAAIDQLFKRMRSSSTSSQGF
jgi:hypothetical protein